MRFNIFLTGLQGVRDRVTALNDRIGNPRPVLMKAAVKILDAAVAEITVGGSPPWTPTKFPSNMHHILIKTGTLRNSLSAANAQAVEFESNWKVQVGTNVEYAKWLQGGTRFMPARAFLKIDDKLAVEIRQMLADFVLRGAA